MRILIAAVLLSVTSLAAADSAANDASIRARINAIEEAWNGRDADKLAAFYAPDGDYIIGNGARYSGRDAISRSAKRELASLPKERIVRISVDSIRYPSSDIAIVDSSARFTGGEPARDRGTFVMVRRGDEWLISALRVLPAESSR